MHFFVIAQSRPWVARFAAAALVGIAIVFEHEWGSACAPDFAPQP